MICVKNLCKTFGEKQAVRDLTFEVATGEILGFLGPNGAGKTTTMRMLTGFFPPTSGTATVEGVDVGDNPLALRQLVGYLPEHVPLYLDMTTREFLQFAASAKRIQKKAQKAAIEETLERCNLQPVADQLVGTLSRGYRQRVGLAQAIINRPKVLILDEPTVGLDPTQVRDIRALLRELSKDTTVILSSHILSEVQQMCQRVIIISQGRMRAIDTPENLSNSIQGQKSVTFRLAETEGLDIEARLAELAEVGSIKAIELGAVLVTPSAQCTGDLAPKLASFVVGQGWQLLELKPYSLDLEQIYLDLMRSEEENVSASNSKT